VSAHEQATLTNNDNSIIRGKIYTGNMGDKAARRSQTYERYCIYSDDIFIEETQSWVPNKFFKEVSKYREDKIDDILNNIS
jgi:hypothetical protein